MEEDMFTYGEQIFVRLDIMFVLYFPLYQNRGGVPTLLEQMTKLVRLN
jgi:hypothetical protein